jgi:predicted CXXCH cytochrome family protein
MRSTRWRTRLLRRLTAALSFVFASGCGEDIVYRDRPPFNPPEAAAAEFVGYYEASSQQTTCGNCHAGFQAAWQGTAHASAWATLQNSPGRAESCEGCHSVNGKGNDMVGTTAGHDAVKTTTYQDVQCESCHGPGLDHVEGVGQGTLIRPLAKISMTTAGNCGDCHSGAHHPFAQEWAASRHANVSASRASNPSCAGCHDGRGALARWGVQNNYVEKNSATAYQPTTCAVCHDPHGADNPSQLRFPVDSPDEEQNLCVRCHLRVGEPTVTSSSPHAPQGAVLLGFAGWRPPGFTYDTARIYGSHATTKNPRLCAGCHIAKFTVTDELTGQFTFNATGHLMRPVPCLDAEGRPTADKTCAYTATARSWQTCTTAGCHGDANAAATLFNDSRALMKSFTDQLWTDLNGNGSLQAAPTDGGMLATVRANSPGEWSNTDNTITPAEGAEFNARLCGEYGQSTADNSKGVHNPFLCRALLIATINYVRSHYGLPGSGGTSALSMESPENRAYFSAMHVTRTASRR